MRIVIFFLIPLVVGCISNGKVDSDYDGLTNWEERRIGTDPFNPDTDKDGLDDWIESKGAERFFPEGEYPSPLRMDLYVELYWMEAWDHTHEVPEKVKNYVISIFSQAPVTSPDGSQGISLHILDGGAIAHIDPVTDDYEVFTAEGLITGWNVLYTNWSENSNKRGLYHYGLVVHNLQEPETIFISNSPGDSFVIAGEALDGEELGMALLLALAENIGVNLERDLFDPEAWKDVQAHGIGISLKSENS